MKTSKTSGRKLEVGAPRFGENKRLDRWEWDFSTCPKEQLYECFAYEFARESTEIRNDVARFRESARVVKTFNAFFEFASELRKNRKAEMLPQNVHRSCIFNFSPEFPDQPFLSIEGKERARRVGRVNEAFRGAGWEVKVKVKDKVKDEVHKFPSVDDLTNLQHIPWQRVFQLGQPHFEVPRKQRKYVAFEMDWTLGDAEIVRLFENWLHRQRQIDRSSGKEARGAGGEVRQYLTWLKELGAWRLLRLMKWDEARDHSKDVLGKSLYLNQARWITAKKIAKERAELFFKESF